MTAGAHLQADSPGAVPGCVVWSRLAVAEPDDLVRGIEHVDRRQRVDVHAEQGALLGRVFVQKQIAAMEVDGHTERPLCDADAGHVIDMGVGEQNVPDRQPLACREGEQEGDFIARIDDDRLARALAGDDEAVLEEWSNSLRLDYDHDVILAILDDLLFTSKIRAAAGQLGIPVSFARSAEVALAQMRKNVPRLVILDLNNPRTDPLGTVGSMRADAALAAVPTVGFVSHVQTDLIEAARRAGVSEVLARSAFAERLPQILSRAAPDAGR